MLKLFKYTCGLDEKFGAATDEQEAYDRRAEVDPTFDFVGVRIEVIDVPGFVITITPAEQPESDDFEGMDRAELIDWLKANEVEYVTQWGETRLRETAQAAAKELAADGEVS